MAGSVKCAKVEFGTGGTYPSPATVHATVDGSGNLVLTDVANSGGLTLTELAEGIGVHAIDGEYHTGVDGDFATQYYNITRLKAFLNDSGNSDEIGIASDVGGNVLLSTHVADSTIHGRSAKFILEVAKDGKPYTTIQSAIDAVPTTGPDAASATQRYVILIYPGVYAEAVLLNKDFVSLVGVGSRGEVIISAATSPTVSVSKGVNIKDITILQDSGVGMFVDVGGSIGVYSCSIDGAGDGVGVGIEITHDASLILREDCLISGTVYAIDAADGSSIDASQTMFYSRGNVAVEAAGGTAVFSLRNCYVQATAIGFEVLDTTYLSVYGCVVVAEYFVSGATGNTSSAITIAPTLQTVLVSPGSAGAVVITANTHTDSATITWPSQNDGLSVGYGANGVDATGALSGYDSYFVRRAVGSGAQESAGSVVCIEEISDGYAANTTHNLYLIRGGEAPYDSGEFIRAYDDVEGAVVFQLTRAGDIINAGSLTVGGDAIINADASGANDSCTLTLRTTESDEIVADYKLYASSDLQTHAVNGVGVFIDGTTNYAPFAASTFYGSGAGLTGLPITGMPPGGSWPTLTSDLVVGPLTVNSAADGSDYKSIEIAAPTSGTNRYTLDLAAPSGGTINGSLRSRGYLYLGTGSVCTYDSGSVWYFSGSSEIRFMAPANRGVQFTSGSSGTTITGINYAGDSTGLILTSSAERLVLKTSANNKNVEIFPHGTGVVDVQSAGLNGSNANGLTIAVTTASKPLTLTPGSGAKVETAAQMKAAGFEAGAAAGVASGSFVDADGNTLTITGGIITAITPP